LRRPARIAVLAVIAATLSAAPAQAQAVGTVVYVGGDGQIRLTSADGSQTVQVTSEGTWSYPSMADDGTIVAAEGSPADTLVRMTQSGEVLSTVTPEVRSVAGIVHAEVSPDGSLIAFETFRNSTDGASSFSHEVWIIPSDGTTSTPNAVIGGPSAPTWYPDGSQVVVTGVATFRPSGGDSEGTGTPWFETDGLSTQEAVAIDRGETLIALAGEFEVPNGELFPPRERGIRFYALEGPPPTEPTPHDCFLSEIEGLPTRDVALSPDGTTVAIHEGEQITLVTGFDPVACTNGAIVEIPGGREPSFSPVPIGGGSGPGPGPVPDPGGELPEGVLRLDGGGQGDPIAQAVFLSQQLFEDGEATRVVLATADRFPDALAGAALAGPDGPILFTSGMGDLDPRTAAEIARVTGGDAPVLVLGGVNAVSEAAAATARAAGGDTPCGSPLPPTCRFAGSGREETAALVADVVVAENPDSAGVAMVAKGDDFADAITGGAFAAAVGIPILLTPTDAANPSTTAWLEANRTELLIALGGPSALADATLAAMPAGQVARVAGADRTATSAAIATDLWRANGLGAAGVAIVNVRAADGWQTALSAAVASARLNIPQLGVEGPPAAVTEPVLDYLAGVPAAGTAVFGFGGPDLVSDEQLTQAAAARG
jgi:putative cell wall-binding protein